MTQQKRDTVITDLVVERARQDAKWGEQNHPDGTGDLKFRSWAADARRWCDAIHNLGKGTWKDILLEEVYEALAEDDPTKLRGELIQIAAVSVAWAEAIDRRDQGG